jgi:hypothetical protein
MEVKFIDSNGRKRSGIKRTCVVCNKEFCTRKDQPYTCCSAECKRINSIKRYKTECAWCEKEIERRPSHKTKSGLFFCSKACKDEAQKIGGLEEIQPSHYGTGKLRSESYRKEYKRLNEVVRLTCSRCGYDEFECGIDIHHVDQDHGNMTKENLMALCSPCHRAMHFGYWKLEELGP